MNILKVFLTLGFVFVIASSCGADTESKISRKTSEIQNMYKEGLDGKISDKERYCQSCKTSHYETGSNQNEVSLYKKMYMQCVGHCPEVDPKTRWDQLMEEKKQKNCSDIEDVEERWQCLENEREEELYEAEKRKYYCTNCTAECTKPSDDPLQKWRCLDCRKHCDK